MPSGEYSGNSDVTTLCVKSYSMSKGPTGRQRKNRVIVKEYFLEKILIDLILKGMNSPEKGSIKVPISNNE